MSTTEHIVILFFFLMIRRPPRSTLDRSSAASDVYKRQGQHIKKSLIALVDEDTRAFNQIMNAFGLPKGTDQEKKNRTDAIQAATKLSLIHISEPTRPY